jgi:hypothetical protein
LGFIYFNYKRQKEQSVHILLASLSRQLYETSPEAFADAEALHARHKKHRTSPKREEIEEVLRNGIARCHEAYIILDALDEYLENFSDRAIRELLNVIQGLGSNVKLMVTSRVLGAMEGIFKEIQAERLEICAKDEDLQRYVQARIEHDFAVPLKEDLSEQLVQKVKETANGRYV